jgi:hypothetical protein
LTSLRQHHLQYNKINSQCAEMSLASLSSLV